MNSSLNKIFRTIWSEALGAWIAVSEITKGKGKRSVSGLVRKPFPGSIHISLDELAPAIKPLVFALACGFAFNAHANPIGGTVVNGQASISAAGTTLTVTNTPGAIIHWQGFSIQANETTRFVQQSAASSVLNRVTGASPSSILGTLQSNGHVFLVNPNGIVFGSGSTVDVAGMVATTLKLSNADFLAGRNKFTQDANAKNISNAGSITAQSGGQIYLIAPNVANTGVITAPNGEVLLAAGHSVELVDSASPDFRVSILAPAGEATNVGQLVASAGKLGMFGVIVRNSGTLNASSAAVQGGKIVLKASRQVDAGGTINAQGVGGGTIAVLADLQSGTVNLDGALDASVNTVRPELVEGLATSTGSGQASTSSARTVGRGNGGFIETSAAHVNIADSTKVTTAAVNGLSGTWLIDPVDFTIAASGGNMTGTALTTALGQGAVTILSTSGTTGTAGNVNVNDAVSWSANKLTLNAQNNININASLNGSGTGSLALEYGQAGLNAGNTSRYILANGAQVNLPAGQNFSTKLGSDGVVTAYTVITALGAAGSVTTTDLQGMSGGLTGNYVLGANVDATATSTWNAGAGFAPLGANTGKGGQAGAVAFTGNFDGLGHTISNLTIARPTVSYVGLFAFADVASSIRNVGLVGGSVSGADHVGGLVGGADGTISNAYTTGSVNGTGLYVGGLVGISKGAVSNSYATGAVNNTGNVIATGGLIGASYGTVSNCYATGNVSGAGSYIGGLVGVVYTGSTAGTVSNSYATGHVSGTSQVGGLVGVNSGTITNSYWNTTTSGQATSAGGTGLTSAQMQQQSNFTGFDFTNVWIVYDGHTDPLLRSFMTALTVTANNVSKTYDGLTAAVTGVSYSITPNANLLGTLSYAGAKDAGSHALGGLYSTVQNGGYAISYVNGALTINPKALTVSGTVANNKVYDGTTTAILTGGILNGVITGDTVTLTQAGSFAAKNVGTGLAVTAADSLSGTSAGNYTVTQPIGLVANITAKALTVSGITTNSKVYDATTSATFNLGAVSFGGIVGADAVTITQGTISGSFADKNVGANKAINLTGVTLSGADAGNYTLSGVGGLTGVITARALTVSGITASNKVYDGSVVASVNTTGASYSGLISGDVVSVSATGAFVDKNAATSKTVTLSYTGADAGNYAITNQVDITADITAATLTVVPDALGKIYGSGDDPMLTYTVTGLIGTDALSGMLERAVGDSVGVYTISKGTLMSNSNYVLNYTPADFTITAPSSSTLRKLDSVIAKMLQTDSSRTTGAASNNTKEEQKTTAKELLADATEKSSDKSADTPAAKPLPMCN